MIPLELKAARVRCGFTQKQVADSLNISVPSYANKERGVTRFTEPEKFALARMFGLDVHQMDKILFDGQFAAFANVEAR